MHAEKSEQSDDSWKALYILKREIFSLSGNTFSLSCTVTIVIQVRLTRKAPWNPGLIRKHADRVIGQMCLIASE